MTTREFDPELYVRMIAEREVSSGLDMEQQRVNRRSGLDSAAAALAVAGVLDVDVAESLVRDYSLAAALAGDSRRLQHRRMMRRHRAASPPTEPVGPLAPRRVYALDQRVPIRDGQLDATVLIAGKDDAELSGRIEWTTSSPNLNRPGSLDIRAEGGQKLAANFSGSWTDRSADGSFSIDGGLPEGAGWVEIEGHRVSLPEPIQPPTVEIEPIAPDSIYMQYLWQVLGDFNDRRGQANNSIVASAEALMAAGLVDADDPELEAVLWVAGAQFPRHPGMPVGQATGGQSSTIPAAVPESWRALLSRRPTGPGPQGSLAIGAVSPWFDGVSIGINSLKSGPEGFSLRVETTGIPHTGPFSESLSLKPVVWWASDDRGNHHLGSVSSWSSGDGHGRGQIDFGSLDPKARLLTVAVTTMSARALVAVPLDWRT